MNVKTAIMIITLFAGSFALPTPDEDHSMYFEHVDPESRIVGGTQAAAGSHPHMVALSTGVIIRAYICGASLITPRSVLTAAHCLGQLYANGALINSLRATVGTNRWNSGGTAYRVLRNVTHPHYDVNVIKNDLSILVLASQAVQSNTVRVVPLNFEYVPGGVESRVAGWGRTSHNGAFSATLLELTKPTLEGGDCERRWQQAAIDFGRETPQVDSDLEVCTLHSPNFGMCNGDSGSALIRTDNGQQFGVVSWGFPCALGVPDVFVRLSAYQTWLQQNVV